MSTLSTATNQAGKLVGTGLAERALSALAEETAATAVLFDANGDVAVGPVAGSELGKLLLGSTVGREAVLAAHRAAIDRQTTASPGSMLLTEALGYFGFPLITSGGCAGTLTLGDRPRRPLSDRTLAELSVASDVPEETLRAAAERLAPWSSDEAAGARGLATAVAELLAELCTQEQNLRNREGELSAVYNIAGLLAGTRDLQEILNRIARTVCEVMKVKACSIRLLDEISGVLTVRAVHNLSAKYLSKGPVTVEDNPIDRAALSGELVRIADAPTDPRTRYPEEAREEGIVSGLVCGLIYRGRAVGVLRVYTGEPQVFTPFEEALLHGVAAQSAAAIVNARLMAETLESERVARQMAYAGQVQRRMIPAKAPVHSHLDIGAVYRPTYSVGGDFYDFIPLPKGNLGIGIADVSGKGVPASLLMASIRSALRVYARFMYDLDRIVAETNRHLCKEAATGEFATLFYGVITPDGRRLTYCNAGHDPPMLLRDGRIIELGVGGLVVGVDPGAVFERGILDLQPGDVLLLYTDGVVEALNFADERFGRERLVQSLVRHADQTAPMIAQNILWDLRRFRGLADRTDDVTMVVVKVAK